ncbi:MAG: SUMF1/EgtB/PvdO family nonheme iron enzyme [Planctomycetaceae bacterium]|nr:SUMF1/EgtB/PvdO family nonheme iron enzyme [Planctomycetaceae bacterium]
MSGRLSGMNLSGLDDTRGNAWEWCQHWHKFPTRVARGGSWCGNAKNCRSANCRYGPLDRFYGIGFRVAGVPASPASHPSSGGPDESRLPLMCINHLRESLRLQEFRATG